MRIGWANTTKLFAIPLDFAHLADSEIIEDGGYFLLKTVQEADDKSLTFLIIAGMRDFFNLIGNHPSLVQQKTKRVAIMGGVGFDSNGIVHANPALYNNVTGNIMICEPHFKARGLCPKL